MRALFPCWVYLAALAGDLWFSRAGDPRTTHEALNSKSWPVLDIVWIFSATLVVSLLLSMLLQKLNSPPSVNTLSVPMKLARGGKTLPPVRPTRRACNSHCSATAKEDAAAPASRTLIPKMRLEKTG